MATRKHTTALGKPFDMDAMRAKHEKMRAVGNMNVNARGDIIDSNNNIINDKNKRVNVMYSKTMQHNPAQTNEKPSQLKNKSVVPKNMVDDLSEDEFNEFNEPNPIKK